MFCRCKYSKENVNYFQQQCKMIKSGSTVLHCRDTENCSVTSGSGSLRCVMCVISVLRLSLCFCFVWTTEHSKALYFRSRRSNYSQSRSLDQDSGRYFALFSIPLIISEYFFHSKFSFILSPTLHLIFSISQIQLSVSFARSPPQVKEQWIGLIKWFRIREGFK